MHKYAFLIGFCASLITLTCYFIYKRNNKKRRPNSFNIYDWMKMGKHARSEFDQKEKLITMSRKKELIAKSRSEYIKYKKSISK